MSAMIINVETSGILSFRIREDSDGNLWFYNLEVEDKPAYLICNLCGTCYSLFERLSSIDLPLTPQEVSSTLEGGIQQPSEKMVEMITHLLPAGKYLASVIEVNGLVRSDDPNMAAFAEDGTPAYMWQRTIAEGKMKRFGDWYMSYIRQEFVLPLVPEGSLSKARIEEYEQRILGGEKPTALALSVIDAHPWFTSDPIGWNLAHFLIDGHHKVMAAVNLGKPVSILSFLSINESNAPVLEDAFICSHYGLPGPCKEDAFLHVESR